MVVSPLQWVVLCFCAFSVGVSKTGVPGIGIINVPLLASVFPAKMSTGLLLPILALTDILAVAYYRRHARWKLVLRLLPWALAGIAVGSLVIHHITNQQLRPTIGAIVLIMLALNWWRQRRGGDSLNVPSHWAFAAFVGFFAGLSTQLANAAGPVMIIYLLAMKLPKNEFIGTGAWYFLILNWLKIPLFMLDGRVTGETLKIDLAAIPFLIVGAVVGVLALKKIPQKRFNAAMWILAAAAAVKLLW